MDQTSRPTPDRADPRTDLPGTARTIRSQDLFGTADTLRITHGGQHYTLRRTRQGKLILTK